MRRAMGGGNGLSKRRGARTTVCLLLGANDGLDFLLAGLENHASALDRIVEGQFMVSTL